MTLGRKKQQKISTEELAKTQVLNLEDVQKLAKYEKIVSKKPAMYVALIGAFSIIVGMTSQAVVSLSAMNEIATPQVNSKVKTEETVKNNNTMTCKGIDDLSGMELTVEKTYTFTFDNSNIVTSYTKTIDVNPTSITSVNALTNLQNGETYYKELAKNSITGYKIVVSNKENGYQILLDVEPNKVDKTKMNQNNNTDTYARPDVTPGASKQAIIDWLTSSGYTCE